MGAKKRFFFNFRKFKNLDCKSNGPYAKACKEQKYVYDPQKSSTAEDQKKPFEIAYGTGEKNRSIV